MEVSGKYKQVPIVLLVYLALSGVYLYVAPLMNVLIGDDVDPVSYLVTMLFVLLFFTLPLFLVAYVASRASRYRLDGNVVRLTCSRWTFLYLIFFLIFPCVYLYVSVDAGMFYRRIGHEGLMRASLDLSTFQLVVTRVGNELFPFFILINYILFRASAGLVRRLFLVSLFSCSAVYFAWVLSNSRTLIFVLLSIFLSFFILWDRLGVYKVKFRILFVLSLIAVLLMYVLMVVRVGYYEDNEISLKNFSDVDKVLQFQNFDKIVDRLDGISLANKLTERYVEMDLVFFEPWVRVGSLYYYQVFDPDKARIIKEEMKTNVKVYIYKHYNGYWVPDYPSSVISDLYVSFFVLSLFLGGVVVGLLVAYIHNAFVVRDSAVRLIFASYLFAYVFRIEFEFLTLIINILKFSFIPFLFVIFKPFNIRLCFNEANSPRYG